MEEHWWKKYQKSVQLFEKSYGLHKNSSWGNGKTMGLHAQNDDKVSLDMKDKLDKPNEYDIKLRYNNDRTFDGWFYLNSIIRCYTREQIPAFIERWFTGVKQQDMEFTNILTKYL